MWAKLDMRILQRLALNASISGHMFTSYSRSFILKRAACRVKANISDAIDWYIIDPDGPGGKASFQAYCSMTDKEGDGVTVISHDTENRTHVDSCDPQGCYERYVTYTGVLLIQLEALIDVSAL